MDKNQVAQSTKEHEKQLERIVGFMVKHNISGLTLHKSKMGDVAIREVSVSYTTYKIDKLKECADNNWISNYKR